MASTKSINVNIDTIPGNQEAIKPEIPVNNESASSKDNGKVTTDKEKPRLGENWKNGEPPLDELEVALEKAGINVWDNCNFEGTFYPDDIASYSADNAPWVHIPFFGAEDLVKFLSIATGNEQEKRKTGKNEVYKLRGFKISFGPYYHATTREKRFYEPSIFFSLLDLDLFLGRIKKYNLAKTRTS